MDEHRHTRHRSPYARRRAVVVVVAAVLVAAVAWAVHAATAPDGRTGASAPDRTAPAPAPATRPTPTRPSTPTAATRAPAMRGLAVTSTTLALVDDRPLTEGVIRLAPARDLPTTVWTPTAPGQWPLVVFVHGYDRSPGQYARFCSTLATAGYVVAAPSFPLEDPTRGFPLDRADLGNEAVDVSAVITSLEADAAAHRLVAGRVAVIGHSDGADVALAVGDERATVDARVRAVVADAPDPVTVPVVATPPPLLLVQGTADSVVPYSASGDVARVVPGPLWYLSLLGADHLPPIEGDSPWTPVLDGAVAAFLDATVADRGPGEGALAGQLGGPPLAHTVTKDAPGGRS